MRQSDARKDDGTLYAGPSDPELLLAALVAPIADTAERERLTRELRAAREYRLSDAGRIPSRDLRHVDLFGGMGNGAWPSYALDLARKDGENV